MSEISGKGRQGNYSSRRYKLRFSADISKEGVSNDLLAHSVRLLEICNLFGFHQSKALLVRLTTTTLIDHIATTNKGDKYYTGCLKKVPTCEWK